MLLQNIGSTLYNLRNYNITLQKSLQELLQWNHYFTKVKKLNMNNKTLKHYKS